MLSRDTPRDPATWPDFQPRPVPEWQLTKVRFGEVLSNLGKAIGPGFLEHARQSGLPVPAELTDPDHPPTPKQLADFIFEIAAKYFPSLVPKTPKKPKPTGRTTPGAKESPRAAGGKSRQSGRRPELRGRTLRRMTENER